MRPDSHPGHRAQSWQAAAWLRRGLLLLRSSAVGIVATGLDLALLTLLVAALGLEARAASLPALVGGIGAQFVGNKLFAFRDRSRRWARQGVLFLAVEALGLTANLCLFDLGIRYTPIPYLPLRLLTTSLVYFAVCLPLWSRIFAHGAPREAAP